MASFEVSRRAAPQSGWAARAQRVAVGLLGGLAAGLLMGVLARIAMRLVRLAAGGPTELTGITIAIIVAVGLAGAFLGIVYVVIERLVPGGWFVKGAAFGAILLLVLWVPFFLLGFGPSGELSIGPPLVGLGLFALLFLIDGLATAAAVELLSTRVPPPRRSALSIVGYGLAAVLGLLALVAFLSGTGILLRILELFGFQPPRD